MVYIYIYIYIYPFKRESLQISMINSTHMTTRKEVRPLLCEGERERTKGSRIICHYISISYVCLLKEENKRCLTLFTNGLCEILKLKVLDEYTRQCQCHTMSRNLMNHSNIHNMHEMLQHQSQNLKRIVVKYQKFGFVVI